MKNLQKEKNKYTEKQIEAAKLLYFEFTPLLKIEEASGIKMKSLHYYIGKSWKAERHQRKTEIIDALTESKRSLMFEISKNGLEVLNKAMRDLVKSPRELSPREISSIAGIITDLDKVAKLDDGSPTDIITETKPATIVEVRKILNRDPFLEIEDKEIEDAEIIDDSNDDVITDNGSSQEERSGNTDDEK